MSFPDHERADGTRPLGWGAAGPAAAPGATVTVGPDDTRSWVPAPHAAASASSAPPPRERRRWPWVVLTLVLVAALGAAVAYGVDTYRIAEGWQDRALAAEAEATRLTGELSTARDEAASLAEALLASESDVNDLEARVDELAAEKAAVADERAAVEVERDVFQGLSAAAADVTAALEHCVELQGDFYDVLLDAGPDSDWELIGEMANETDAQCAAALGQARSLQDAVRATG